MPPAIGIAIAGVASAGAGIYGANKQSSASNRAADIQGRANTEALAYEKDVEARRRQEYDQQQVLLRQQWDANQARLEPARQARAALIARVTGQPIVQPQALQMPAGGTVGALAGGTSQPAQRPMIAPPIAGPPPPKTLAEIANWNQWGAR